MRFVTYAQDGTAGKDAPDRAGVISDAGIHPLPPDVTVLNLVQAGLPAALAAASARWTGRPCR